eukprot:Hpha_TRINITY_DN15804_c2_g3::TRINITY_DN15804_c2_g3_i1::g.190069::m.190069
MGARQSAPDTPPPTPPAAAAASYNEAAGKTAAPLPPVPGDTLELTVLEVRSGGRYQVLVPGRSTVADLKEAVERASQAPSVTQRLIFAGRQLDNAKTLASYGVVSGATLHLAVRQPKGCTKPGLQELLDLYEITLAQSEDLKVLAMYDIVFLVDDSGSMNRVEVTAGVKQSRWQELRDTVGAMIEFASYFDDDGTDIYFLNRAGVEGVTDPKDERLERVFAAHPSGTTPLTRRFREVVQSHSGSKPLLVMLATDGEPDDGASSFMLEARRLLSGSDGKDVRLGVLACTQDERAVHWLNQLDDDPQIGHKVDVCDDYESEKEEVLATGRVRQFLISDYYVKALLGPILSKYDNLDLAQSP